jgi:transposase
MSSSLPHPVLPFDLSEFVIEEVNTEETTLVIRSRAVATTRPCPDCGQLSGRLHSRYQRVVRDLPVTDYAVRLHLSVRRFLCDATTCPRRTFTERLPNLAPPHAQRTVRLTHSLAAIGFAAGGEAGARLATRLRLPTSGDTLLRILRSIPPPPSSAPSVIGIDDFALRRGRVYGTIIVDLETHRPIDLFEERSADAVVPWLQARPTLAIIARDRAQEYARAASEGAPQAIQVADRFHLLVNLRETLERAVQRLRSDLRQVLAGPVANQPEPASPALTDRPGQPRYGRSPQLQRLQEVRRAEREQRYQEVKRLHTLGLSDREVARRCGLSARTVGDWTRTETLPPDRRGYHALTSKIDPYIPYLQQRLIEGCTNQSGLWREIRTQGFTGTRSLVAKWIRAHFSDLGRTGSTPAHALPSTRQLAWLLLRGGEEHTDDEQALWQCLREHEELAWVREMAQQFCVMVREQQAERLDAWLAACHTGPSTEMRTFAAVLERDYDAVHAALTWPWSTGPVEGQIHRLKLIKRSGYGRSSFPLLRQRVLQAA